MSEIKEIMDALGRNETEGNVRGSHLGKILQYLQMHKTERMKSTLAKLALVCGMNIRYVRENYLEGLIEYGIISINCENNDIAWNWVGCKALTKKKNNGDSEK